VKIRSLTLLAVLLAALAALVPGVAMASSPAPDPTSVPASVSVSSFMTMTLPGATSISFGTAAPGSTAGSYTMDPSNPTYIPLQVSTNDPSGYALSVSSAAWSGGNLLVSDMSMKAATPSGSNYTSSTPVTMTSSAATFGTDSIAAPNPDTWGTAFELTVPVTTPAGSYTSSVTYVAAAN
jgi:hypothetical protein